MKDRRRWVEYARIAKKPPPEHGIKMNKAGTTWWGQRWIDALENVLQGDSRRLARGRTYARAGRTHDLVVAAGKVTAQVTGSRATPYEVSVELLPLSDATWKAAIAAMAEKAQFSAELLGGRMPRQIDEAFHSARASLFPRRRAELATRCSCPDWGDPCKHVAATHYVLGEALDRDPFLLFELRGRTKERVFEALRAARGGKASTAAEAPDIPKVALGKIRPSDYDKAREALPALRFSFDAPSAHGAVLKQLGVPATWTGDASPADALAPLVHAAAEAARRIAMAEPEPRLEPSDEAPNPAPRKRRRSRAK